MNPGKSSCWHCPNAGIEPFKRLKKEHPKRFAIILKMEENATVAAKKRGKEPVTFVHKKPLADIDKQGSLDDFDYTLFMCRKDADYCNI